MSKFHLETASNNILEKLRTDDPGKRYILVIAGIPGSGKTTLATKLTKCINSLANDTGSYQSPPAIAISMDGFHLTKKALSEMENPAEAFLRRGSPWTFDGQGFLSSLKKVISHHKQVVTWPSFDHSIGDPILDDENILPGHYIVIIEGNYLLYNESPWDEIRGLVDESWFLECDLKLAENRLIKRHLKSGVEPDLLNAQRRVRANDLLNANMILEKLMEPTRVISVEDDPLTMQ